MNLLTNRASYMRSYERHMIEANREYWANSTQEIKGKERICVYHAWPTTIRVTLYEDIVIKGLQSRNKCQTMSVSMAYLTDCKEVDELDDSFGIKDRFHLSPQEIGNWFSRFKTYVMSQYLTYLTYGKKEKLFRVKYRGIEWGNRVHDVIVQEHAQETKGKEFDCFAVRRATYFQYVKSVVSVIDQSYAILKKMKPTYIVTTEVLHINGLFADVASKMGIKFFICGAPGGNWKNILHVTAGNFLAGDMIKQQVDNYLKGCSKEEITEEDLFVIKREVTTEQNLAKRLKLDSKKKNVFIMPHSLSDSPRESYRHYVYHDYNEWLISTLKIAKEIPEVNWIVKNHPMAAFYQQDGYIKSIFETYKTDNMFWCDKDVSGMQIKEIADCVVTCAGEVGLEYWAYGIPTITTSEAYYCKWGISYQMKTLEEYKDALRHIEKFQPPAPQSMEQARRYLTALKHMGESKDDLVLLCQDVFKEHLNMFKRGIYDISLADYDFCKRYTALLKENRIKDSSVYRLENICEVS